MTMVMNNEFGLDFLRKLHEKKSIENELTRLAVHHNRNMKHNVYLTKAQAMRNQVTKDYLDKMYSNDQENSFFERNHIPKLKSTLQQRFGQRAAS